MNKIELRRQFLSQRKALTAAEVQRRSQLIAGHFFDYFENEGFADTPAFVHTFLPILRNNEVDTWPIIKRFWTELSHVAISVPVMDPATHRMLGYTISADTPLVENRLGIPEPATANRRETDLKHIIAVLVPLLAFDQQGQRVGYGGGYYDRFLAEDVPGSRKIGLSLFEPIERIDDVEPTDIRLDACITPGQIYRFSTVRA